MKEDIYTTIIADIETDIADLPINDDRDADALRIEGMLVIISSILFYEREVTPMEKLRIMSRIHKNLGKL